MLDLKFVRENKEVVKQNIKEFEEEQEKEKGKEKEKNELKWVSWAIS